MKIIDKDTESYAKYLETLSIDELYDILQKIDKKKYREKYQIALSQFAEIAKSEGFELV